MSEYFLLCLRNKDPKKIFANLIREVEGLPFNHVEILKVFPDGVSISFGAVSPKSRWCALSELELHYEIVDKIPLRLAVSDEEASEILFDMVGKPYSQLQILIIMTKLKFTQVLNWLPYVKLNLLAALICTEYAGYFMQEACKYKIDISTETLTLRECVAIAKKALLTDTKTQ